MDYEVAGVKPRGRKLGVRP